MLSCHIKQAPSREEHRHEKENHAFMVNFILRHVVGALAAAPLAGAATNMQVTSSALPATGGSITPNGLKFFTGAANYTITVNAGWSISSILIDGVASAISTSKTVPFDTTKAHTIKVTFSQGTYSITTSAGPGGQLQITGGGATGIAAGSSRNVIVTPSTGYKIHSYIVDGAPPVVPADPMVAVTIPFNNITANHSVSATFDVIPVVTAYAGLAQSITANGSAPWVTTLNGSASSNVGAISYQWDLVSYPVGATAGFSSPTSATTPLLMDKAGIYSVTLTATSGGLSVTSAPATITVQTPTQAASSSCITCHNGSAQVVNWQASIHATTPSGAACPACHMPNGEAHPGLIISTMGSICSNCHLDNTGNVADHPVAIEGNPCTTCHDPHSTVATFQSTVHYNNITSGMYPASYVTSRATCADCHYNDFATTNRNAGIRHTWYSSAHASHHRPPLDQGRLQDHVRLRPMPHHHRLHRLFHRQGNDGVGRCQRQDQGSPCLQRLPCRYYHRGRADGHACPSLCGR